MVEEIRKKNAIAMIELIFALVIMGIVLMSAPMLIQQSIKSSNIALKQEAIVAAASQTSIVLSMHWDENNSNSNVGTSPVLRLNLVNPAPAGLDNVFGRTTSDPSRGVLTPSAFGSDINETGAHTNFDDVDDYDGSSFGLILYDSDNETTADVGEYVDTNITIKTTVRYVSDANQSLATPISNVKAIKVNLTSNSGVQELDKDITFDAFSCNIGTYSIFGGKF